MFFCFNDTATTEIYTLSLHDALPICNLAEGIGKALSTDYFQLREEFSPEQMDHLLRTRSFVEDEVLPVINGYWERAEFPRELAEKLGAAGLVGDGLEGYGCPPRGARPAGLLHQ